MPSSMEQRSQVSIKCSGISEADPDLDFKLMFYENLEPITGILCKKCISGANTKYCT